MSLNATNPTAYQAPPTVVRAAVLSRRFKASPAVSALLAELAFGAARDHAAALPANKTEVCS